MLSNSPPSGDQITVAGRNFLIVWAVALVILLSVGGWLAIRPARQDKLASLARHCARLDPQAADPGATAPDLTLPPNSKPTEVIFGIYVDRIVELSVKDASWTVDFYLWFRWHGDAVRPGEGFQVVDGWIESKEREVAHTCDDEHYERYRVVAKITKPFDVSRFPCDDHLLTINIENPLYQRH